MLLRGNGYLMRRIKHILTKGIDLTFGFLNGTQTYGADKR